MSADHAAAFGEASETSATSRSTPRLFAPEVAAQPCRYPCPFHDHASDLPSNYGSNYALPAEEKPFLNSSWWLEVPDE